MITQELPFILALTLCVIANTLIGGIKHTKLEDFDFKALLQGAIKYLVMIIAICLLVISMGIYEPLALRFKDELELVKQAIVIIAFSKVVLQIKDYFNITDEDIEKAKISVSSEDFKELG